MVEGPGTRRVDGPSGDGWMFSDRIYSGKPFVAHDGTVIDSRKKHREYMKRHNLTTADDFKGDWARKQQERAAFYEGRPYDTEARREAVAQAIEQLSRR
jgi:hypothetical protein